MKTLIFCASLVLIIVSCKSKAQKDAQQYHDAVESVVDSYKKPTSKDGLYCSANVNGKEWVASKMLVDMDDPVVQAYNESNEVILFYLGRRMEKGKPYPFEGTGGGAAKYNDKEDALSMWNSEQGDRTITNMDDKWIEGTFQFTAASPDNGKKVQVTNGFFRIPKPEGFHFKEAE